MSSPLLEARDLTKHFGGLAALQDLDLQVDRGEILGVIGPNGAGKTTFFNLVAGAFPVTGGRIEYEGRDITNLKAFQIARLGITRSFQAVAYFRDMTVFENIVMGCYQRSKSGLGEELFGRWLREGHNADIRADAEAILGRLGLAPLSQVVAKDLPYGKAKLLSIGVAIGANPKLLLLDEPFGGINAAEMDATMDVVRSLRAGGITVIVIDHNMRAVMKLCDRLVVLHYGRKIAEGAPQEIAHHKDVLAAYLGGRHVVA